MALRLVRSTARRSLRAPASPPGGGLREATLLVEGWLAESFASPEEASADLVRRVAARLAPRDQEINRLASLLWEVTRRQRS